MCCGCLVYQAYRGGLIHGLCSCTERFQSLFLGCTAPEPSALVLTLPLHVGHPQASVICPGKRQWRHWLTGAGLLTYVGKARGSDWLGCVCSAPVGFPVWCPWRQGLVCGERVYNGGSAPCAPLSNGPLLPRQPVLPPGAFLAAELLTPILSGCLHAVELLSHPLSLSSYSQQQPSPWVHSPNCMLQYPASISNGGCTSQAGACRAVAHTISGSLTLSCPIQTSCCTFF